MLHQLIKVAIVSHIPLTTTDYLLLSLSLKQCENYRTIALVSHASKILLRIIYWKGSE